MRAFTALIVSTVAVAAQEIGFTGGPSVASGTSAINAPNVNNGWQADSSLFASGDSAAPNTFNGVFNSHFTSINSNLAASDNLLNNPGLVMVGGNSGWTANGANNVMGPVQNDFSGAFVRRSGDVIFANGYHGAGPIVSLPPIVYHPVPAPYTAPIVVIPKPAPIAYSPPVPASYNAPPPVIVAPKPAQYVAPPPPSAPAPASYGAAAPVVNYKKANQMATIVQNKV
ncbi:hypothetical protein IWW38_005625 [Coemansia aciculifera]|uniref:Uncharacterized protein n=1 Tax=Coemansia aciculifera TaxID=417176 RepID=A0ACC1LUJ8_9FUNG|nr:hypothetical protein IWW38_005625 [Coemansia aciculifera]